LAELAKIVWETTKRTKDSKGLTVRFCIALSS
jgi:hypothetical protein